jgi:hypothetical protein
MDWTYILSFFTNRLKTAVHLKGGLSTAALDPLTPGIVGYIKRPALQNEIRRGLTIPGMQMVICGPVGSGKSTLLTQTLKDAGLNYITTHCRQESTLQSLLRDIFDSLTIKYSNSRQERRWEKIAAALNTRATSSDGSPLHLTPQRLANMLATRNLIWVVEDAHLMAESERVLLLELVKVFSDLSGMQNDPRVILLGNTFTALELFYYDANMANRITEVMVPYMEEEEMLNITGLTETVHNLPFAARKQMQVVAFSNALPGICQQLCTILIQQSHYTAMEDALQNAVAAWLAIYRPVHEEKLFKALYGANLTITPAILAALSKPAGRDGFTIEELQQIKSCRTASRELLVECLSTLTHQSLLTQNPYTDAWNFADPYMKAYAAMHFWYNREIMKNANSCKLPEQILEKAIKDPHEDADNVTPVEA